MRSDDEASLEVDGSTLEGGGQIYRVSLCLAGLLRVKCHIHSIRSGRPKPGLSAQHVTVSEVIQFITRGHIEGATLGSGSVRYAPYERGAISLSRAIRKHVGTAGAITLIVQAALPCLVFYAQSSGSILEMTGGTNVAFAPPVDHLSNVLLPILSRMGVRAEVKSFQRGYYPTGGGNVCMDIQSVRAPLHPLLCDERGRIVSVHLVSFGHGPAVTTEISQCLEDKLTNVLRDFMLSRPQFVVSEFEEVTVHRDVGTVGVEVTNAQRQNERGSKRKRGRAPRDSSLGAQVWCITETGDILSANALESCRNPEQFQGIVDTLCETILRRIALVVESGACVDEHTADQLLVYMALAQGHSRIICPPVDPIDSTLHIDTAIHVVQSITKCEFVVQNLESGCRLITCDGIGFLPA